MRLFAVVPLRHMGLSVFAVAVGLVACQHCSSTPSAVVNPSVDLAVCVLSQYASDPTCRTNAVQCAADIAVHCGTDAAQVVSLLAAHRAAMVADGVVIPPGDAGK